MAAYESPGVSTGSVAVLSPQQFCLQLEAILRAAIAAGPNDDAREEAARRLFGILREVPSLGPGEEPPSFLAPMLVDGVGHMIGRRRGESVADPDRLLADLMKFVLAFYPQAAPPASL